MQTTVHNTTAETVEARDTVPISAWKIGGYFLFILLCGNLGTPWTGSLVNIPINFYLKDQLKLGPETVALFGFLVGIPFYVGCLPGLLRDRWQPLGGRDRGYLLVLPPIIAALLFWLAAQPLTYGRILMVMLVGGACGVLLLTAIQGLMAGTAQRHAISGRLATALGAATFLPPIVASYAGGWLTAHVRPQTVFAMSAVIVLLVAAFGWRQPHMAHTENTALKLGPPREPLRQTITRLARHRPLYLPAVILFLWNFAPGWQTPLFFYLTEHVKLSSEVYGMMLSIQNLITVVFVLLYGLLCRRYTLHKLLWAGFLLGLAGAPLYWFIHTAAQSYAIAVLVGASVGLATTAFFDLLLRCCPKGSEGVAVALSGGAAAFAWTTADIFGSWLYVRGGFGLALIVTVLTNLMMIPVLRAVPRRFITMRDGERDIVAAVEAAPPDGKGCCTT